MEVVAEEDVVVQLDRLSVNMKRVAKHAFTDRDDLGFWLQKAEALNTARDNVMGRPGRRLVAEMMRHEEAPVVYRFLLLSRRSRTFVARF